MSMTYRAKGYACLILWVAMAAIWAAAFAQAQAESDLFNWAIQGKDPAIEGCPGQYAEYAEGFIISCWGRKDEPPPAELPVCKYPHAGPVAPDGSVIVYCLPRPTDT